MKKHPARKSRSSKEVRSSLMQRVLPIVGVVAALKDGLRELVVSSGMQVLGALLEDDRERLCGPKRKQQLEREAYRYGHDQGQLVMGGRKVSVVKPRVRRVAGGEVRLPTWEAFRETDPLDERVVEQMLCGVSTRKYERSLEPLDTDRKAIGVKKSSVSRRFITATSQKVNNFLNRPLGDLDLPVIMIDGLHVGEQIVLGVLGIDVNGNKHVLGLCDGPSESDRVCRGLFRELIERGLVVERARLFVIDGSAGLHKGDPRHVRPMGVDSALPDSQVAQCARASPGEEARVGSSEDAEGLGSPEYGESEVDPGRTGTHARRPSGRRGISA